MTVRLVHTEVIYLRVTGNRLRWRAAAHPLPDAVAPDEHVRALLGPHDPATAIVHSTSWRHDPYDGSLILTWVALPDPDPDRVTFPVDRLPASHSHDPAHPVPAGGVGMAHVVSHAVRHLALLAHTDPVLTRAVHADPGLHNALLGFDVDVAGGIGLTHLTAP